MNKYQNLSQTEALPIRCAAWHPSTDQCILISRFEMGYHPFDGRDADELNKRWGVDSAQAEAMLAGSMWGWTVPGAHPKVYAS